MKRNDFFQKVMTCYNALVALLLLYLIVTSLAFSCEYFFGTVPDGSGWVFGVIGTVFAIRLFMLRMVDVPRKADRLSVENGKDLLAFAGIIAFGVMIFLVLAWGWIKIYPQL